MKQQDGTSKNNSSLSYKTAYLLLFVIIALGGVYLGLFKFKENIPQDEQVSLRSYTTQTIIINKQQLELFVADTPQTRTQGLSNVEQLAPNQGMLFVFDEPDTYSFWMKDMNFSLDILWLDEQGSVVHIEKNISPDTFPQSFTPPVPAQYVLELSSGYVDMLGIQSGQKILTQ